MGIVPMCYICCTGGGGGLTCYNFGYRRAGEVAGAYPIHMLE